MDRALGVVLMGFRHAEDCQHSVADVLFHAAAIVLDGFRNRGEVRVLQLAHLFRVHAFAQRSEAGQIGEQHGNQLALLVRRRRFQLCQLFAQRSD